MPIWTQICLVPVIGSGTRLDPRRPKYFADGTLPIATQWGGTDYGFEPWMLVSANLVAANVTFLQAQVDVSLIPVNLDALLTAPEVATVQAKLEAIFMPSNWLDTTYTWRIVLRRVLGVFRFMARFSVVFSAAGGGVVPIFSGGIDLTRTFGSLSATARTALQQTANELNLDSSGVTGATTLRQLLNQIALQADSVPQGIGAFSV